MIVPLIVLAAAVFLASWTYSPRPAPARVPQVPQLQYQPRKALQTSGFTAVSDQLKWAPDATLQEIADAFRYLGEGHAQGKIVITV